MKLPQLSASFVPTRDSLHQVAFFALGPARYKAVGRMGLRAAPGGFGTPEFAGRVARVEGDIIVLEETGNVASQTITTVRAAAEFLGIEYEVDWYSEFRDPLRPMDPDIRLEIDDEASRTLGHWFEFGYELLGRLREHAEPDDDVSEVQLWPEHFDPATELGSQELGRRASYGASPGDPAHEEPYVYVSAWGDIDRADPYWNDRAFNGSSLGYGELAAAEDPVAMALEFLLAGHRILRAT